ncbi:MAG: HAMP domain-containing sensor histidine kinase [Candidatus Omnitrophota bacterium]
MLIVTLICFVGLVVMAILLVYKMDKIKEQRSAIDKLKKSLDEMDEQAKLIVRTDMELNKAQEELDKKIRGLFALQGLSRSMMTSLEENQIFRMLTNEHLAELGFEKAAAFLWNSAQKRFEIHISIGYSDAETNEIKSYIEKNKEEYLNLIKEAKTVSSISRTTEETSEDKIAAVFKTAYFIIPPILPKEGNSGFLFVGTDNAEAPINEGDKELITVLANQLAQALENARLFDKTWKVQQSLEEKVGERTSELTSALKELQIVSRRKNDFISSVSHELRTPLTSIKGYAAILLAGKLGDVPPEIHQRLEKINKHSDELVHMVNDLLDIARIESGKQVMKKEEINLKEVTEKVADLLGEQTKEKNITFSINIADDASLISADRQQIERVFTNIAGNALKFTPEGGKITVSSRQHKDGIQIDISDTGCGIPENAQDAIFEEFYRVDNPINEGVKGTGLGLSLVKQIVEAHNGKIWVKSKIGSGSTFSFTLPKAG